MDRNQITRTNFVYDLRMTNRISERLISDDLTLKTHIMDISTKVFRRLTFVLRKSKDSKAHPLLEPYVMP